MWLTVLAVPNHNVLVVFLFETAHYDREHVMEENCSLDGQGVNVRKRNCKGPTIPIKGKGSKKEGPVYHNPLQRSSQLPLALLVKL